MEGFADIIIFNAEVFTADENQPHAQAVALRGNRILFVGSDADAKTLASPATRLIDARGRTVMPGFIDSHFHLISGSTELRFAQLQDVRSVDELSRELKAHANRSPMPDWVVGMGLVYRLEPISRTLTRHDLDAIIPDRPVVVDAFDSHTSWANTEALRRAGLLNGRDVGEFGKVVIGPDGLASGELHEGAAIEPVHALIPEPSEDEKKALLLRALEMASQYGLTSVHNMNGNLADSELLARLDLEGHLPLRVYMPLLILPESNLEAFTEAIEMRKKFASGMIRGGLVKFFMDGVIESHTGLLLDDYTGAPGQRGTANFDVEHFTDLAIEADRLGFQIAVHCTGDAAVRRVLDAIELAHAKNGKRDSRHRVEHVELISDADLPRFASLGAIASMQPSHRPIHTTGSDLWPERVGPGRWRRAFAWRTLRDAGARLAFGSDWTVASMNPLQGVHAALTAPIWQPGDPEQRQTLEEALLGYTRDAAYAEFMEHEKGALKEGFLADVVILSENIFDVPAEQLLRIHVDLTICNGEIRFER